MFLISVLVDTYELVLEEVYPGEKGPLQSLGRISDSIPDPITNAVGNFVSLVSPVAAGILTSQNKGITGVFDTIKSGDVLKDPVGALSENFTGIRVMNPFQPTVVSTESKHLKKQADKFDKQYGGTMMNK